VFEEVIPNVFVFYPVDKGSNCFLLIGKKTAVIDSGLKSSEKDLIEFLQAVDIEPREVDLVLHTHGHCDHFAADNLFKNAEIWMHEFDAAHVNSKDHIFTASELYENNFFPEIKKFFKEEQVFELKPFELEVLFTPGHTKGSVCFLERNQKLLFSGDTLFNKAVGRHDCLSGSKQELLSSLKFLKTLDFDFLLPGHERILKEKQKENLTAAINLLKQPSTESFL
jgi:glyoxylase-like metal-dependent hydrolase (beta-lactamase superfamily II)